MNRPNSTTNPAIPNLDHIFPRPFPTSPHAAAAEQDLHRWLHDLQALQPPAVDALSSITSQGIAHALPHTDPDSLALCARLFAWLTALDDVYGETAAVDNPARLSAIIGELVRALDGDDGPKLTSPFAVGLRDLLGQFRSRALPLQYIHLTGRRRDNLLGLRWEAHHLAAPQHVSLRAYNVMRPDTVFVRTLMAAVQIVLPYELTEQQQSSQSVRQLETAVANLSGWVNDIASYSRESRLGRTPLSLPTLLMAERHLSLPKAFAAASRMCTEQAATARSRINDLVASSSHSLQLHAQAMNHIVHAFVWHVDHDRYRSPDLAPSSRPSLLRDDMRGGASTVQMLGTQAGARMASTRAWSSNVFRMC